MDLAIYAHPWDLRALAAHGGLPRLADLGIREVALAVSYHAGRWFTPWQPDGMVRFLEDGTVHYRPRGDYGALQPVVSSEVRNGEPSPLEWLCDAAPQAGLRARAWAVLTHNTRLGELHPDCCVQNAFGDRYSYSLCPGNEAVQHYAVAMVRDLAAHRGLHAIELEAVAPIGHRHNSHHDKSSFASEAFADQLLSTCFCGGCGGGIAALEQDGQRIGGARVAALRAAFAGWLRRRFGDGDAMLPPEPKLDRQQLVDRLRAEFGEDTLMLPAWRAITTRTMLRNAAAAAAPHGVRLCAQTGHDALRQAAAMPLALAAGLCGEVALTVYGERAGDVGAALPHLIAARGDGARPLPNEHQPALRLCLHPRAPQYGSDDDLRRVRDLCAQHGVGAISIYHLGLLPWRTIERAAKVLSA